MPRNRHVGLPDADIALGQLFGAIVRRGLPLVPLWGGGTATQGRDHRRLSRPPCCRGRRERDALALAASLLLVGFQLGNTGVMLATIRDVVPRRRLGSAIAIFGVSGPIGFAVGPALGGILVDGFGLPLAAMYVVSGALSLGTALLIALLIHEVRPSTVPAGRILDLAYGAVRGIFTDRATARLSRSSARRCSRAR